MVSVDDINLFALSADLGEMTDPSQSEPSDSLTAVTVGELVDFADAVRAYECTLKAATRRGLGDRPDRLPRLPSLMAIPAASQLGLGVLNAYGDGTRTIHA